jgi:hypothetical protein
VSLACLLGNKAFEFGQTLCVSGRPGATHLVEDGTKAKVATIWVAHHASGTKALPGLLLQERLILLGCHSQSRLKSDGVIRNPLSGHAGASLGGVG